jgi:phosphatidylglycerophosphate synthase
MKDKLNIPNLLSALRIILSLLLLPCAADQTVFFSLFVLCGISDLLDGFIARRYALESAFGARLDSAADFIFFWIMLLYLFLYRFALINTYKGMLILIVLVRFAALSVCFIRNKKFYTLHTLGNKAAGALVILALGMVILRPVNPIFPLILVIVLLSALEELLIMLLIRSPDANMRSIFYRS